MSDQVVTEVIPTRSVEIKKDKKPKKRINYALAGTLLHSGMSMQEIAVKVGAANANTLRSALCRKGVNKRNAIAVKPGVEAVQTLTQRVSIAAAEMVKEKLTNGLVTAVDALLAKQQPYGKLLNKGQGQLAGIKTAAEAFRALHGGADNQVLVFGVGTMHASPVVETQGVVVDADDMKSS